MTPSPRWPAYLTLFVVVGAVVIFIFPPEARRAADVGDFLSGVAGALAFIWLIAGFQQQRRELASQARDLQAQREALEGQRMELRRMAKHAALGQIAAMLQGLTSSLGARGVALDNLPTRFVGALAHWKHVLENKAPQTVFDNYMAWLDVEGLIHLFLSTIALAARLYGEVSDELCFVERDDPAEFVVANYDKLLKVPHLAQYTGVAKVLAESMVLLTPGRKKVREFGMKAINELMPGVVNPDAMIQTIQQRAKEAGA